MKPAKLELNLYGSRSDIFTRSSFQLEKRMEEAILAALKEVVSVPCLCEAGR
jgi:hypothetical protein